MFSSLFPNISTFAGLFLFLKIYTPTRLYVNNTICLAISISLSLWIDLPKLSNISEIKFYIYIIIFALLFSFPYWLSGLLGGIIQQMLVLNEQSVQDKRFTEESEALGQISNIIFLIYALNSGFLFIPFIELINGNIKTSYNLGFKDFYLLITNNMTDIMLISTKYISIFLLTIISGGYIDLFFKKASLSSTITQNCVPIVAVILMSIWFLSDQSYIFNMLINQLGYKL